jgi:phosphatidylinositol-3-phosphatase
VTNRRISLVVMLAGLILVSSRAHASIQDVQTVFIILMENHDWSSIKGSSSAPYINNTLLPMASRAEQYYNPPGLHPSLPNYLWLEAGTNFGITSDLLPSSAHQNTTNHLVTLLNNAGISWRSYQEDICGCLCPLVNSNLYVPRHNPMVYFDDVTNTNNANSAFCIANVRPYTQLAGDLQSNTVARYNFLTPNQCNNMHNSSGCATSDTVKNGDTWLSNNIPAILNSQAYSNNGAIFIVWDEGAGSSSDGPIGMIVLSPLAKGGGYFNTIHYTHSSTLRTLQEIFDVTPLLGDAVNATDLSDLFVFGAQLAVSPATAFDSSGLIGGSFVPNSQTYALSNTGGVAMVWSASKTVNWLDLSATSGTLAAGASTNIDVSINANANSFLAGSYSDTVSFATSNGSGNATRPVSLTVINPAAQLVVSPASAFGTGGPPGGPFNPISQTYAVSNSGGASMSWTANNTANWLTLSATSGTLASGASTNVTASINTNAISLAIGSYADTIGFTNTTNGAGNTTRSVSLSVSTFGFFDDFSTFASGDLVGQSGWTQLGGISNVPIQVVGGQAGFTGGLTVNSQTAFKNFTQTNETVFYGMTLTVTNAPNNNGVPYFATLYTSTNGTGTAGFRLAAESPDTAKTNFLLGVRINPAPSDPYTFGTAGLTYGTQYRVIVQAVAGGTNVIVYVNPTSGNLGDQTPYAKNAVTSGGLTTVGSFAISQLDGGTIPSAGGLIGKVAVGDNFGTVYNDLLGALPPSASFTASPTNGVIPLTVTFADSSSGTITNWFWDFGDGDTTNINTSGVMHTYVALGTFSVTLVVTGPSGISTNTQPNSIVALTAFQSWQIQYFGSTSNPDAAPNADPDGDGQNNTAEFLAGTDPTDSASVFQIISIARVDTDVLVTWTMGNGKTNALQRTDGVGGSYSTNNFADIFIVTNTVGTVTNYVDIGAATNVPALYYRVRLVP